ncbi:amino acid permease (plasmid) [Escherichia albertii]|uniref:putative glutamine/gamma-aminobutyrate antiporter GadC n=1 Tax=Escherichia albertii TaxID=208962 RepID=UPI002360FFBE|nr:putative glutamine/gamma-aminobutyrate antiporter GadC [Escherichia albertii]WDB54708.1 amino acid permease [Escherichia albertii]
MPSLSNQKNKISAVALAIMNITTVVSLRGLASEAEYGITSAFYYLFAALFFLIPVSLVAAELATGWPQKGGVFRWIGEAFGHRCGFIAIYLQWLATTIWFPTVLIFTAVSLAFIGPSPVSDSHLASNRLYTVIILLIVYWCATFVSLRGIRYSSKVATLGGLIGTIIPSVILMVLTLIYIADGGRINISIHASDFFPDLTNLNNVVLASSIFLFFAGMEINAVHVVDIDRPEKNYPLAIIGAAISAVIIFVFGTLCIAFLIPKQQINLVQSIFVAYNTIFDYFGLHWLGEILAAMLAFGALGQITAIVAGPSTGLLEVGRAGYLPPFLQKTNKHGVQQNILIFQGAIVSIISTLLVILPSVQSAYQILGQLASILYLLMYIMMFSAALYLRHKEPDTLRPYRVPGGKIGMWIISGCGLLGSLIAFGLSFIPPSQIPVGNPSDYVLILFIGFIIFLSIPIIVYANRKPSWNSDGSGR